MIHTFSLCLAILIALGASLDAQELEIADMGECELESGEIIEDCRIAYRTAGQLDSERSNVVLFPTWFTGNTEDLTQFVGPEGLVDSSKYFVIMVDAFADGVSSSPSNSSQQPGTPFPEVSIRDMVRHQHRLLTERLDIDSIFAVIGISMGGMQAFEWAVAYPGFADKVIPIAGSPRLAVYDIVLWDTWLRLLELYRLCGACDEASQAMEGLNTITLQSPQYHERMTGRDNLERVRTKIKQWRISEGQVLDWASQLRAMIKHNVASPYRDEMKIAAARVTADMLVIVGEADHMVTPAPALEFSRLVNAEVLELATDCGHAATWCETERISQAIRDFLALKPQKMPNSAFEQTAPIVVR